jgi:hypothetical protein
MFSQAYGEQKAETLAIARRTAVTSSFLAAFRRCERFDGVAPNQCRVSINCRYLGNECNGDLARTMAQIVGLQWRERLAPILLATGGFDSILN